MSTLVMAEVSNLDWSQFDIINSDSDDSEIGNIEDCPHCKKKGVVIDDPSRGIRVCRNDTCGIVIKNLIDSSPEWRSFANDERPGANPSRCGMGTGGGTVLHGNLGKINQWVNTSDHKARSIWTDKQEIEKKCMPHHISRNTIESAKYLWERLCQSKYPNGKQKDKKIITRGRNRKSIMAACVWAQDRDNDPKVIAKAFDLDETSITSGHKKLSKIMGQCPEFSNLKHSDPRGLAVNYAVDLDMDSNYIELTKEVIDKSIELNLVSGNIPKSIATGAILFVATICKISNINKKRIGQVCEISEVTVNKTFDSIYSSKDDVLRDLSLL